MLEYDFNDRFNEREFENFGCDIVEVRENFTLERHNKTKDLGIDGKNKTNGKLTIVQCKRVKDVNNLIKKLESEELEKVKRLNPNRYILVLSSNPTVKQKEKIKTIFNGYIKSSKDIITAEDLNSFLRHKEYQNIKNYYDDLVLSKDINIRKLLENIKNPVVSQNSRFLLKDINEIKEYFIETKVFQKSYELLRENHIIFLSGDAGSGKTTNAKMLLNHLLNDGLIDMVYKVNSCDELISILDPKQKQGILFDDFWGSTFEYLKLGLNEEKKLQDLLEKVEKLENIYFILTTREYVLNQGISFYRDFNNKHLDKRVIHKNCNYTKTEKVKILFSHAKNSNLDLKYLNSIKFYAKELIEKINYSPRLVSFYINKNEDTNIEPYEFINDFQSFLKNPTDYLESIFYKLSEGARIIAFVLSFSDPEILMIQLRKSFQSIAKHIPTIKPSMYEEYLKELLDFFVEINKYRKNIIDFTNYSIHDFINNEFLKKLVDYEDAFCKGVIYFNQIYNLLMLEKYQLSKENINVLISKLITDFESLKITQDLDEFIEADESEDINPFYYKSHKIWKTLHILNEYKIKELEVFLQRETESILKYYEGHYHDYEHSNFVSIPDLIKYGTEIGITFNEKQIVKDYINNCEYFYELFYVTFFPKSYKTTIDKYMKELGNNIGEKVEDWILEDLDYLSEDGISMEYETTIEDMPEILKMLGLKPTPELKRIIEENKREITNTKPLNISENSDTEKENKDVVDKEIKKYEKEIYSYHNLSLKKLQKIITESTLSSKNKTKIKDNIKSEKSIWLCLQDSSEEYAHLVINYYEQEEINKKELITDWQVYPKLLEYIKSSIILNNSELLERYAHEIVTNDYSGISMQHLKSRYKITDEEIKDLQEIEILKVSNNIILFSDTMFTIYLAVKYIKEHNSKKLMIEFLDRDGLKNILENIFMEEFNTYNYHHTVIFPIVEKIIQKGKEEWKKNITDIKYNIEEGSITCSYSTDYWILNDYINTFANMVLEEELKMLFENYKNAEEIEIGSYYFNNNNKKEKTWQKLDEILNIFYEKITQIYKTLKENESEIIEFES